MYPEIETPCKLSSGFAATTRFPSSLQISTAANSSTCTDRWWFGERRKVGQFTVPKNWPTALTCWSNCPSLPGWIRARASSIASNVSDAPTFRWPAVSAGLAPTAQKHAQTPVLLIGWSATMQASCRSSGSFRWPSGCSYGS